MGSRWIIIIALCVGFWASSAHAHPGELGITIEPTFAGLPAVADVSSKSTLSLTMGGGLAVEYSPLKLLAVVFRVAYTHPVASSQVGEATFANRTGTYYFSQLAAFTSAGVRLETPSYWLPIQLFVGGSAGATLFVQTERELRNAAGVAYEIPLADVVKVWPILSLSGGVMGRVTDQIRLNLEGSAHFFPQNTLLVGFGVTIGITFLFFG